MPPVFVAIPVTWSPSPLAHFPAAATAGEVCTRIDGLKNGQTTRDSFSSPRPGVFAAVHLAIVSIERQARSAKLTDKLWPTGYTGYCAAGLGGQNPNYRRSVDTVVGAGDDGDNGDDGRNVSGNGTGQVVADVARETHGSICATINCPRSPDLALLLPSDDLQSTFPPGTVKLADQPRTRVTPC